MAKAIGVLTSGGDAPGMNAAVRAVTRFALNKGIKVYGIRRGYNGLINGDIFEMGARDVSGIIQRGGNEDWPRKGNFDGKMEVDLTEHCI